MKKFDVKCWSCFAVSHETTDKYEPGVAINGAMFRLKDNLREAGWTSFPETEGTVAADCMCPRCEESYARWQDASGQLAAELIPQPEDMGTIEEPELLDIEVELEEDMFICPECGKECATLSGLKSHMRSRHPQSN